MWWQFWQSPQQIRERENEQQATTSHQQALARGRLARRSQGDGDTAQQEGSHYPSPDEKIR